MKVPMFVVGTERDHIAPWHSVFKLHLLNDGELTFVLTSGGHNAGIVSEPGHKHRHLRIRVRDAGARTLGPNEWEHDMAPRDGSWWPQWGAWLDRHSSRRVDRKRQRTTAAFGAAPALAKGYFAQRQGSSSSMRWIG